MKLVSETISHIPEKFGIKAGAENFPLMVVVSVSYICNGRCPNCPYTQSTIRLTYNDAPLISVKVFSRIADEVGRFNSWLRLTGGGEPLLHPELVYLIEYAKKAGCKVGLITNGSMLTPDKAEKLLEAEIDVVEFSVDAADPQTYAKVRPGLDFNLLKQNILWMVRRRDELQSQTKIIVSVINQKEVKNKIKDIVSYWKAIVDNVQVRKFLTWGFLNGKESGDPTPYLGPERVPCPFPFERLNVDTRGDIFFCGFDIRGEFKFGNVMETSIQSVWKGDRFNEWRALILKGRYEEIPLCRKCSDWKYRSWKYNYWKVIKDAEERRKIKHEGNM